MCRSRRRSATLPGARRRTLLIEDVLVAAALCVRWRGRRQAAASRRAATRHQCPASRAHSTRSAARPPRRRLPARSAMPPASLSTVARSGRTTCVDVGATATGSCVATERRHSPTTTSADTASPATISDRRPRRRGTGGGPDSNSPSSSPTKPSEHRASQLSRRGRPLGTTIQRLALVSIDASPARDAGVNRLRNSSTRRKPASYSGTLEARI
jgi:hypothetical protein